MWIMLAIHILEQNMIKSKITGKEYDPA